MNLLNKFNINRIGRNRQLLLPWVTYTAPGAISITATDVGVDGAGIGTYLWRGTVTATGTGSAQIPFVVDSGVGINDAYYVRQTSTGTTLQGVRALAAAATVASLGNVTANVEFRVGMVVLGDGSARYSYNGAVSSLTGGPTSGLTRIRLNVTLTGSCAVFKVLPDIVLSDSDLINAVSGL